MKGEMTVMNKDEAAKLNDIFRNRHNSPERFMLFTIDIVTERHECRRIAHIFFRTNTEKFVFFSQAEKQIIKQD